jgi:SSS family solute:Na+ symporter/sodium/pantothenate symporter
VNDNLSSLASPYTLLAFGAYMVGVFLLGALSHKLLERGSFLKEYFLGDRKLNAWVLGLTYVATSVSAGSFVGFPSLIYRHGWIMALWIGGYMMAGLVSKGVLAKRLNQVSRISGAITVPDVLRDRFHSPALGFLGGVFLLIFLAFNLVAQFKAGGLIMRQACGGIRESTPYVVARQEITRTLEHVSNWREETAGDKPDDVYDREYPDYILGILIFAVTVVVYTTYGGFWAVTWTDVLQGLVIVAGAVLLMILALRQVGGLDQATLRLREVDARLWTGPGPDNFVPLGLATSYFFLWTVGAMGQPVGMVRLMACRDTPTLRRSLFMITVYFALIYLPLVITFICARAIYPSEHLSQSDRIMPVMALTLTQEWPVLGGVILAAPYAAAMSAVAGFLLLMTSSLVRDIYQRNINPSVSRRAVRWISYGTTAVVGTIVTLAALRPPQFLQHLIIFTTGGMACTYLAPTVLALYWPRATKAGALTAMLTGFFTVMVFYILGWNGIGKAGLTGPAAEGVAPIYLFGFDPLIYGMLASFAVGITISWVTRPLPSNHIAKYFLVSPAPAGEREPGASATTSSGPTTSAPVADPSGSSHPGSP